MPVCSCVCISTITVVIATTIFAVIVVVGAAYTAGWYFGAASATDQVNDFWLEYLNSARRGSGGAA